MPNLNTVDPTELEAVTGGAIIASGSSLNNNAYLQSTLSALRDVTHNLRNNNNNNGLFGGGNSLLTTLLFSRLLGPRPPF